MKNDITPKPQTHVCLLCVPKLPRALCPPHPRAGRAEAVPGLGEADSGGCSHPCPGSGAGASPPAPPVPRTSAPAAAARHDRSLHVHRLCVPGMMSTKCCREAFQPEKPCGARLFPASVENYSCSLSPLLEQLRNVQGGEGEEEEGGVCAFGVGAAAFFSLSVPLNDLF